MTLAEQIVRLSKLKASTGSVVSVYLNTRWTDEHQRERTRLFLKGELHRAREASPVRAGPMLSTGSRAREKR